MISEKYIQELHRKLDEINVKVGTLESDLKKVREENSVLKKENTRLKKENLQLKKNNNQLRKDNIELKEEIRRLKKGTDSSNSSKPPSSDMGKKKRVKKTKNEQSKKIGGQKGHKGQHLKFRKEVDHIVEHEPINCSGCGSCFSALEGRVVKKAQVIDIPPVRAEVTEHRQIEKQCTKCGKRNTGRLPGTLDYSAVQYGENIRQLITYLSVRQYLPMARISELIEAVCGERLSVGTIANTIEGYANKLEKVYWKIRDRIATSKVVGSDETGARVNGIKALIWTWQNEKYTFQFASDNRAYRTIEYCFNEGLPYSILIIDRYAAQLKTKVKAYQLCIAHLLRDSKKLIEHYGSKWAKRFKKLLLEIHQLGSESKVWKSKAEKLEKRLDRLLSEKIPKKHKEVQTFYNSMKKHRDKLTTCLDYVEVPPTNNASERAIRNVKIKQKVSTNFRSWKGAKNFTIIRSIIDTAIKQGQDPFKVLFCPEMVLNSPE